MKVRKVGSLCRELACSLRLLLLLVVCAPDRGTSPAFVLSRSWMASETLHDRVETSLGDDVAWMKRSC
jgi:hypothetical protein